MASTAIASTPAATNRAETSLTGLGNVKTLRTLPPTRSVPVPTISTLPPLVNDKPKKSDQVSRVSTEPSRRPRRLVVPPSSASVGRPTGH